ncbi:MAG: hypothetical protein A3G70_07570 [Planctomycetes bacterium RIFCSPLOWO2_12_FULL_39_13]|nr:MAG: hypothetical protein A3G70_07570 [Planctomycetes bacterium RIFCSPLOWO2_12_FULL_39_13]
MSKKIINLTGGSNWETIAFLIINKITNGNQIVFYRKNLMSNIDFAINFSPILGHKKNPEHPEETLQRTIQNLRDKGYIEFLGNGKYKLSMDGYNKMLEEVNSVKDLFSDR